MAAIYLIRHGQASFGSADYDKLSAKGCNQANILGASWQLRPKPKKYYCGDLLRHEQTLSHFIEGHKGIVTPKIIHSGFNEFDHVDILHKYNDKWSDFANMTYEVNQLTDPSKTIKSEFSNALNRWLFEGKDHEYKESWPQFKMRCIRALRDVIEQELAQNKSVVATERTQNDAKDILVFTSGGTISVIIQHILQLNDQQMLAINQQTRNTSVTKLLFSGDKLSVDYINNYSHLERLGDEWVTFR
ncbi:histidine phosphatase family protein [Shewanella donghaensis]|uniref:histidine phosphatase family protein n=1 Tax=Shewanella donghaensis TaxID=238836 RepID=UPI001183F4D8|nr:histidine phosphatase family protein [Shewanella donghaensis]